MQSHRTGGASRLPIILFDLDGTIMDSAPGVVASFRHALALHGVAEPDGDLSRRIVGPPMDATVRSLGLNPDTTQALLDDYQAHYTSDGWRDSTVFDGMADLLDELAARPLRLAVTTSKQEDIARRILEEYGLDGYFDTIAGAEGRRHAKANVIAEALTRLWAEDAPAVVLAGDRRQDVEGGDAHGIPVAFVQWGYGASEEAVGAAWLARSPEHLGSILVRYTDAKSGRAETSRAAEDDGRAHITFVCTGNICRSPMAANIVRAHLEREGLGAAVRVTSSGTGDWHIGQPADPRTREELVAHGYPDEHTAAQMGEDDLSADLIVALDSGHRDRLIAAGAHPGRIRLLRSFEPGADSEDVADPYYGGTDGFTTVRRQIEAALPGLMEWARARA